jgi:hypothetical protein
VRRREASREYIRSTDVTLALVVLTAVLGLILVGAQWLILL